MHVLLIGLRCSGKSTVGRLLADRLQRPFIDLDDRTPAILDCATAGDALRAHGEPAFRAAETQALRAVLAEPTESIIALGGGTPTAPGAAAVLLDAQGAGHAVIVYLRATPEVLAARMTSGEASSRPALIGPSSIDEVPAIFIRRDPLYTRLADRIIDAAQSVNAIVEQVAILGQPRQA